MAVQSMRFSITVFTGYGPASAWLRRNAELLVEALRELGLPAVLEEVRVPALDFEEFEPFAMMEGVEVHIPVVQVPLEKLVEYFIATELPHALGASAALLMPLPPSAPEEAEHSV